MLKVNSMIDVLILRFDAPLMSFGAPIVDNRGVVQPYPALSMMTGLVANALGVSHAEADRLEDLQDRLRYAVRQDRAGEQLRDYQTVDLSKPYMDEARAWTTRHELETRKGGSASSGTHIRLRDYWADAAFTLALTLDRPADEPTLQTVSEALVHPARPLFIGRKACLPAGPIHDGTVVRAETLVHALSTVERSGLRSAQVNDDGGATVWWPVRSSHSDVSLPDEVVEDYREPVTDRRDWTNQIHVGTRWLARGTMSVN